MANTPLYIDSVDEHEPVLAMLYRTDDSQVVPNASGYVLASTSEEWLYEITINELLTGIYRVLVQNGDGITVGQGYCRLTDTTNIHRVANDYYAVSLQEEVVAALNGTTWEDEEANTFVLGVTKI
jgi:hypothetical protein